MIETKDYEKSNKEVFVKYNKLSKKEYEKLYNAGTGIEERQRAGQKMINYLCDKYNINRVPLKVLNAGRQRVGTGEMHGRYNFNPITMIGNYILIYNLTAVKKNVISIKTFIDTLLHEFIHHYDVEFLKINTHHSKGFYLRISDLHKKLKK